MRGCELVFHAAGVNAFCLRDPSPLFRVNVEGTRAVVEAAARAGIKRVVYTSSAATIGEATATVGNEQSAHRGWFLSSYERSKFEAEHAAMAAARGTGIELVCVNPASVQGPGRTSGTAKLLLDLVNGRLPGVVDSHLSFVDVADCATGHLLAAERGTPGERYVLCGGSLTTREALAALAEAAGVELGVRFVRPWVARAAALAEEAAAMVAGRRPRLCRELAATVVHGHIYDGSRAKRELGLEYTPVQRSLARTLRWYTKRACSRSSPIRARPHLRRHPRPPPKQEAVLRTGQKAPDVRPVEDDDRHGGPDGEREHRPTGAEGVREGRQRDHRRATPATSSGQRGRPRSRPRLPRASRTARPRARRRPSWQRPSHRAQSRGTAAASGPREQQLRPAPRRSRPRGSRRSTRPRAPWPRRAPRPRGPTGCRTSARRSRRRCSRSRSA